MHILTYSYLLLPATFLIFAIFGKIGRKGIIVLAFYGIIFFCLNNFAYDLPKDLQKLYLPTYTSIEYFVFAFLLWSYTPNRLFIRLKTNGKEKKVSFKNVLFLLLSVFFYGFLIYYYSTSVIQNLDAVPIGIESILIFIFIFYFFHEYFNAVKDQYIYNSPAFWIIVGILIYLGGTFFFNLLYNSLSEEVQKFWYLTFITETIKNILFTVALVIYLRQPHENSKKENVPNLDFSFNEH